MQPFRSFVGVSVARHPLLLFGLFTNESLTVWIIIAIITGISRAGTVGERAGGRAGGREAGGERAIRREGKGGERERVGETKE